MNEEITREFPDNGSFAERVFARFDAIDARLEKLEARSYDTKPIWERALAEITATRSEVGEINVRLGVIEKRVEAIETRVAAIETRIETIETRIETIETRIETIETRVDAIETRLGGVESHVAGLRSDYGGMRHELLDTQRESKRMLTSLLESLVTLLTDTRHLMRNNDARLKQLESKLA